MFNQWEMPRAGHPPTTSYQGKAYNTDSDRDKDTLENAQNEDAERMDVDEAIENIQPN